MTSRYLGFSCIDARPNTRIRIPSQVQSAAGNRCPATSPFISSQASRASVTEPASSIVEMSPGSLSSTTAFNTRRMILPLRVFGSMWMKFSSPMTTTGPSSCRTVARSSFSSSADGAAQVAELPRIDLQRGAFADEAVHDPHR